MDDLSEGGKKRRHGNSSIMSSLRRNVARTSMWSTSTSEPSKGHPSSHSKPSAFENIYTVRDKSDATAKRAFRVQIPRRLLYYTAAVFLVLPLFIFGWKETHLHPEQHNVVVKHHLRHHHDRRPAWMDEDEKDGAVLPLKTLLQNQTQTEDTSKDAVLLDSSSKKETAAELENVMAKDNESPTEQVQSPKDSSSQETHDVQPPAISNNTSQVLSVDHKDETNKDDSAKSPAENGQAEGDQAPKQPPLVAIGDDLAVKEANNIVNEQQELLEDGKGEPAIIESEKQGRRRQLRANHTRMS